MLRAAAAHGAAPDANGHAAHHHALKHHRAELAHHVPGRLRIKIKAARDNMPLLESLRHVFAGVPGIDGVVLKPSSGSVVLHYDPELEREMEARFATYRAAAPAEAPHARPGDEVEALAEQIEAEAEYLAGRSEWAHAVVEFFKESDRIVRAATGNAIDLKIVLALALAVVTFLGVGAEAATPMWVTLVLFALNHFLETHPLPAPAPAAAA
jgi:hypothetical protein